MSLTYTVAGRTLRSVGLIAALSAIATVAACDNKNWDTLSQTNQVGGTDLFSLPGTDGGTVDPAPDMVLNFCPVGTIQCGNFCRHMDSDPFNCGACGIKCQDNEACISGSCQFQPSCDDGIMNGQESDVDCGGNCAACKFGQKCVYDTDCPNLRCGVSKICRCLSNDECPRRDSVCWPNTGMCT